MKLHLKLILLLTSYSVAIDRFDIITFNGHNFYFYADNVVSKEKANLICHEHRQNLITIEDEETMTFIQSKIQEKKQNVWIGLESHSCSPTHKYWRWNNTGLAATMPKWCPDENTAGSKPCAYADHEQNCLVPTSCESTNDISGFICEDRIRHTNDYEIVMYQGSEYYVYKRNGITFHRAKETCFVRGKQLITFDNLEKTIFFNKVLVQKRLTFWIGLESYTELVGNYRFLYWRWKSTGKDINIKNWCPDNVITEIPACVYTEVDSLCWKTVGCTNDEAMSFVCENRMAKDAVNNPKNKMNDATRNNQCNIASF